MYCVLIILEQNKGRMASTTKQRCDYEIHNLPVVLNLKTFKFILAVFKLSVRAGEQVSRKCGKSGSSTEQC